MASNPKDRDTPKTETIEGVRFRVVPLGFDVGLGLFVRLTKSLGPALGIALSGAPSLAALAQAMTGGEGEGGSRAAIERAIADFCGRLDVADVREVLRLAEDVTQFSRDGQKWPYLSAANREELFRARYRLAIGFVVFFLRAQFSDFFGSPAMPPAGDGPEGGTQASSTA